MHPFHIIFLNLIEPNPNNKVCEKINAFSIAERVHQMRQNWAVSSLIVKGYTELVEQVLGLANAHSLLSC